MPAPGLRNWRWGLGRSRTRRKFSNLSPSDTVIHRTPSESPHTYTFCKSRPAVDSQCPRDYCAVTNIESLLSSVTCSSSLHILPPFPFHFLNTLTCLHSVKMVKAQTPILTGHSVLPNWSQHFRVSWWLTWVFISDRSPCNRTIKLCLISVLRFLPRRTKPPLQVLPTQVLPLKKKKNLCNSILRCLNKSFILQLYVLVLDIPISNADLKQL